ncbi:MAG: phospholipase D-like domain-containing protein [Halobacteriales archaeon]
MYRRLVLVAVLCGCVVAPAATTAGSPHPTTATGTPGPDRTTASSNPSSPTELGTFDRATIVAVYPDPVVDGDRGECVVVDLPATGGVNWSLADGEGTIRVPEPPGGGQVAVSDDPSVVCNRTDARTVAVEDMLRLSNSGEVLALRADDVTVDTVAYDSAQTASWYRNGSWHPLGATDFDPVAVPGRTGRVFVLPDSPEIPLALLRNASDRILLAGYTFTSERIARALRSAAERGVAVRVLLDGAPVGGLSGREARLLDRLVAAGVEVRVLGGPRARYDFHHAKYAVVDDRAVVVTENWKPSGTGGRSSRGWGVVLGGPTADRLARVFRADAGAPDAIRWEEYRTERERSTEEEAGSSRSYPARFQPRRVSVDEVEVIVAPDNAGRSVRRILRSANSSIRIIQMRIDGRNDPFLRVSLAAARRGVRVEILLSSARYVREDNRELARWLRRLAREEGLPLAVRLAEPRSTFEKIHAKGVVVDGERVLVGSLNWNEESWRNNREVLVVVHGREAAAYFERVFRSDWRGGVWRLPVAVGTAVALAWLLAVVRVGRWVSFDQSS